MQCEESAVPGSILTTFFLMTLSRIRWELQACTYSCCGDQAGGEDGNRRGSKHVNSQSLPLTEGQFICRKS